VFAHQTPLEEPRIENQTLCEGHSSRFRAITKTQSCVTSVTKKINQEDKYCEPRLLHIVYFALRGNNHQDL
jgi:hypothetical protein